MTHPTKYDAKKNTWWRRWFGKERSDLKTISRKETFAYGLGAGILASLIVIPTTSNEPANETPATPTKQTTCVVEFRNGDIITGRVVPCETPQRTIIDK